MPTYSVRHRFAAVRRIGIKDGRCPKCGGETTRQKRFEQTLNPFNKNAAGVVKTQEEIVIELLEEIDAWTPDFTHAKCKVTP